MKVCHSPRLRLRNERRLAALQLSLLPNFCSNWPSERSLYKICVSPWIFIHINNLFKLLASGIEPLTLGLQGHLSIHSTMGDPLIGCLSLRKMVSFVRPFQWEGSRRWYFQSSWLYWVGSSSLHKMGWFELGGRRATRSLAEADYILLSCSLTTGVEYSEQCSRSLVCCCVSRSSTKTNTRLSLLHTPIPGSYYVGLWLNKHIRKKSYGINVRKYLSFAIPSTPFGISFRLHVQF